VVVQLQGGAPVSSGPSPAQILQQFDRLIDATVEAAEGNPQARAVVEQTLLQLGAK